MEMNQKSKIPLVNDDESILELVEATLCSDGTGKTHLRKSSMKTKVLLADDDERVLALVAATLGKDGSIEIFVAKDGDEALKTARQEKPEVMFLDVMMPKMNGYDVCQALKRDPATANIKVILLTGLSRESNRRKAVSELGADAYITKPFSPINLLDKFEEFLDRSMADN